MFSIFQTVGKVVMGRGCAAILGDEAKRLGAKKIGLIMDEGVAGTGVPKKLCASLDKAGLSWSLYDRAEIEPSVESAIRAGEWARDAGVDLLVGAGGGSSMDTAKAAALLARHAGPPSLYYGMEKAPEGCLPLILAPTTAGTGSEMTSVAVLTDYEANSKPGIVSRHLYARVALLDPELTIDLPPFYTAITGMDALVHAMESYVSRFATFLTDALNLRAMRMIVANIRRAFADGGDIGAREGMLFGAAASGMAFSNTQNGVIHALGMSFPPSHHVPHGLMMSICAPMGLAFNAKAAPEKIAKIAEILGCAPKGASIEAKAASASAGFQRLMEDLKIPQSLSERGIERSELEAAAGRAAAYKRLMDSNPASATPRELLDLLERFYS